MKLKLAGVVAAAAFAVVLTGCSDSGTTGTGGGAGGGGGSKFCTSTSCATGETCHPTAKVCIKTCNLSTDCTAEAKTCASAVGGGSKSDGGVLSVCTCFSNEICAMGTANTVCAAYDAVCVAKCASNSDCPNGRTCNVSSGQCAAPGGGTDGGTDAGTACTSGSCSGSQICTLSTGVCEAPKTCVAANQAPDTCLYGQFCTGTACTEVTKPGTSCPNFTPGTGKTPVWNGKTTMGPIIYSLVANPGDNNVANAMDFCGANKTFTVTLKAYNPTSMFPADAMASTLAGLKYVKEDGSECDAVSCNGGPTFRLMSGYTVSTDRKVLTLKISLCPPLQTLTNISAGFYFTGGNETCVSVAD